MLKEPIDKMDYGYMIIHTIYLLGASLMFAKWENKSDLYTGLIFLIVGVCLFSNISSLNVHTYDHLGSKFFPQFICASIGILGAVLTLKTAFQIKRQTNTSEVEPDNGNPLTFNDGFFPSLFFVLTTGAYFIALQKGAGFVLSTSVYLFIEMLILNRGKKNNPLHLGLFAIITSFVIYWIFEKFLMLMLP